MKKVSSFFLGILFIVGCQNSPLTEYTDEPVNDPSEFTYSENEIVKGRMRVKFKEEPTTRGVSVQSIGNFKITHMERTFPHAGKYEGRTRREGLHLWYDVWFSEDVAPTRALEEVAVLDNIEIVSPVLKIVSKAASSPFNDPRFSEQWGLENRGEESWQIAGADIRLMDVWEQYNGHPDVIVAVLDEGVYTDHPDLKENIWVNPGEIANNDEDDDNNGYPDDINGYNFVENLPVMYPSRHGTHVAGIIAARNNNNIGVSGIAGGNGTPNSGVRLMCCQILKGTLQASTIPAAIKYGADNGAIISQNSWGFSVDNPQTRGFDEPAIKEAIDYFVKYAGCDDDGNQLPNSPMKGGIVLFAVNNKNSSNPISSAPADYEKVMGVAAMGPDFKKAPYSDYGSYVDISAPGGIQDHGGGILSTATTMYDYYSLMSGASMACPHVSGVAALVIQKYGVGKPGFTAEQLTEILLTSAYEIDSYNPDYVGKLGTGCVNAYAALYEEPPVIEPFILETNIITDGKLSFKTNNEHAGNVELTIRNHMGIIVLQKKIEVTRYVTNTVDVSSLASGTYEFKYVVISNGNTIQEKFVKY
ncbi:S8 family serine peptidase [Bacteroides sp. 519]|uniref:S8 family serine peptidase n=1 Tax=Bacteroides sp. 519 TaxID=2302937 RepID=UPI0013D675A0|nr:S8 family serine peptidase [Bacteroides sp. 519]NDV59148.1 peptidase [Bacteroides sp. 519]